MFELLVSGARTQTQPESAIIIDRDDGHMYESSYIWRGFWRMVFGFFLSFLAEACFDSRCEVQNSFFEGDRWDVGGSIFVPLRSIHRRVSMNLHTFSLDDSFSLY